MSTLKDRLLMFIDKEGLNPNQFYVKTGLANGFLDKVGNKMNRSTVEKIEKAFPHLNIDYLVYGKGEMIKPLPQVSGNILVGNGIKNVQLGHGSNIMHGNEADQEVMSSLQARIIELEKENKELRSQLHEMSLMNGKLALEISRNARKKN